MSFQPEQNVDLAELTTFKIGGQAAFYTVVTSADELPEIFAWLKSNNLPHFILSGGSNTIFDDGTFKGVVIKIDIKGFELLSEDEITTCIRVGAGENWDAIVAKTIDLKLSGIEALSGIPGMCGAAPIQNIGAYGQEIKDTTVSVEVFDTDTGVVTSLTNAECEFEFRNSTFKATQKDRYIITAIILKLSKLPASIPQYKDAISYFKKKNIATPNLPQIRRAILEIRRNKFMDPAVMPNAGSFFKNPIVSEEIANKIMADNPSIKLYPEDTKIIPLGGNKYKIAAGWLIQELGLKGLELEKVRIDPNHALVLENKGGASQKDLKELVSKIQDSAIKKYGIALEPEPVIVEF